LIQIGMALFMTLPWLGVLFLTGKLEMWHAAARSSSTDSPAFLAPSRSS